MQKAKEILLELLKPDGQPERQLKQYEAIHLCLYDPLNVYLRGNRKRGVRSKDRWGVTIDFPEDAPGAIPVNHGEFMVCKDITKWKETVIAPDLEANCKEGWEECIKKARAACGDEKLLSGFMGTGIFEQCHFLMGFENTLTNLYEHPDEMHALIDYITDYRIKYAELLIDNLHPEVLLTHDDWGTKDALFMKPDMWREFFKEPYRRFYGFIRSKGVIAIHHADSYLVPIIEDMVELGIQVWQGTLPENDIPKLQKQLKGRMVLMGGLGAAIDRANATPEEIMEYTRNTLKKCASGGHFIPSITYGVPGAVFPQVDPAIDQAIDEYNAMLHIPSFDVPDVPRRIFGKKTAVKNTSAVKEEASSGDIFESLGTALYRGQQKKILSLCEEAISEGHAAQDIISKGLMSGMNTLGDDFSANRVFVPEMLVAARCMSAATQYLKPYMVSGDGADSVIGKACIGTVRGDMHDIGKNLVKIMMEGSGIEVYDLGADVEPERFVETAIEHDCDLIVCSALLTTTMEQMRSVVQIAKDRGIRDNVTIFVGGAPISQSFCDEIGADIYTEDAGSAARAAVSVLTNRQ